MGAWMMVTNKQTKENEKKKRRKQEYGKRKEKKRTKKKKKKQKRKEKTRKKSHCLLNRREECFFTMNVKNLIFLDEKAKWKAGYEQLTEFLKKRNGPFPLNDILNFIKGHLRFFYLFLLLLAFYLSFFSFEPYFFPFFLRFPCLFSSRRLCLFSFVYL